MRARFIDTIEDLPAAQWDALAGNEQPFVGQRFLHLLETTGCVGPGSRGTPRHLVIEDGAHVVAVAPAYLKTHSYGEYVFDFAWANAYQRAGLRYYPKLVVAVPFTPVTGPRLLAGEHAADDALWRCALDAVTAEGRARGWSSAHWLFPDPGPDAGAARAWLAGALGCAVPLAQRRLREF